MLLDDDRRRLSAAELERRLERCRRDYEAAKARIAEVGFVCEGSLLSRRTCCNNPNCRCARLEGRHGPYWQLTWKEDGRTVTRVLSGKLPSATWSGSTTVAVSRPSWPRCASCRVRPVGTSRRRRASPSKGRRAPAVGVAQPASAPPEARKPGISPHLGHNPGFCGAPDRPLRRKTPCFWTS